MNSANHPGLGGILPIFSNQFPPSFVVVVISVYFDTREVSPVINECDCSVSVLQSKYLNVHMLVNVGCE